jgi:hypothetical protein
VNRVDGESRKDVFRQWMIGVGVAILLLSGIGNVVEGYSLIKSGERHHTQTVRQDSEILSALEEHSNTLKDVKALEEQVDKVIAGLPAADADIVKFAAWIESCLSTGNCKTPPSLNPSTTTTTTP